MSTMAAAHDFQFPRISTTRRPGVRLTRRGRLTLLLLFVGLGFVYLASAVVRVPLRFLIPTVLVVSTFGSYAIEGALSGPITLVIFSVIGWAMVRYHYPVAAVVVGLLLGSLLEQNLIRTWQISRGDLSYLLERPGAILILALMILSMGLTAFSRWRRKRRAAEGLVTEEIGS